MFTYYKMILSRRMTCVASAAKKPESPIQLARKAFEKKRITSLKENINKLVMIATADTKEVVEFIKELDELHKKELMPNAVKETDVQQEENIFLKQE